MPKSKSRRPARPSRPLRRRWPVLAGALAVVALALAAAALWLPGSSRVVEVEPGAPGRLVAEQTTVDLGRVPFDKLTEARFELANTGGGTVRLTGAPRVKMLEGC